MKTMLGPRPKTQPDVKQGFAEAIPKAIICEAERFSSLAHSHRKTVSRTRPKAQPDVKHGFAEAMAKAIQFGAKLFQALPADT
jgi:3-dehydroquinate synthetase